MIPRSACFLVAGIALACIASGWTGYKLGRADGNEQVSKMYRAGVEVVAKRQTLITKLKRKSSEDADRIADLSRDARVRICPEPRVPAGRDLTDPGPAGDGGAPGEDITDILRQCLRSFGEINRAVGVK